VLPQDGDKDPNGDNPTTDGDNHPEGEQNPDRVVTEEERIAVIEYEEADGEEKRDHAESVR
jgi:hypothetical protein